jgi:catechol 2,3-dioxygenase-like lactoylglutathione lyase family enzyme
MSLELQGVCPLIQVFDMPESVRFYCELLEFKLVTHSPFYAEGQFHWAMLRGHGAELKLNTAYDEGERPSQPEPARLSAHGDTALYFDCPDVDAAHRTLVGRGLDMKPPTVAHYGMKQLYFRDPDGYGICFQHPVPGFGQNSVDTE